MIEEIFTSTKCFAFLIIVSFSFVSSGVYFWFRQSQKYSKKESAKSISKATSFVAQPSKSSKLKHTNFASKSNKLPPRKSRTATNPKEKVAQHPLHGTTFKGFSHEVTCVSVHPCGTKIVISSSDSTTRIFSTNPASPTLTLENHAYIRGIPNADYFTAIDFSVDGTCLFGATGMLHLYCTPFLYRYTYCSVRKYRAPFVVQNTVVS